jgi:hypothetical protein
MIRVLSPYIPFWRYDEAYEVVKKFIFFPYLRKIQVFDLMNFLVMMRERGKSNKKHPI